MGKVIPLDINRRTSAAVRRKGALRGSFSKLGRSALSAVRRAAIRSAIAMAAVLLLASSAILVTMLAIIGRPLRVVAQLGAISVLVSAGLEYFDHWRHLQLLFAAVGALVFVTTLNLCHARLLERSTRLDSSLRGRRA